VAALAFGASDFGFVSDFEFRASVAYVICYLLAFRLFGQSDDSLNRLADLP